MSETEAPPFPFLAGASCLDFANTAFREEGIIVWESLDGFGDVLSWGVAAGLLAPADAERTAAAAGGPGGGDEAAFARALELREQVYRTFAALAERKRPDPRDLAALDRAQREAFAQRAFVADGDGFRWSWPGGGAVDGVLWRVAESAAELLVGGPLERVRRCAGDDCTRLFLDTSRSGRRRWCDMSHCGNIAKARRFRTRHRDGPR